VLWPPFTRVGDLEIEAGWIIEAGAYRATVMVRAGPNARTVRAVGYIFEEVFSTQEAATKAAEKFALLATLRPFRHLITADNEFSLQ